jgi:hypothetical protein
LGWAVAWASWSGSWAGAGLKWPGLVSLYVFLFLFYISFEFKSILKPCLISIRYGDIFGVYMLLKYIQTWLDSYCILEIFVYVVTYSFIKHYWNERKIFEVVVI